MRVADAVCEVHMSLCEPAQRLLPHTLGPAAAPVWRKHNTRERDGGCPGLSANGR
jgi:hypothetical protein